MSIKEQKNFVSDYLEAYPEMRYIMPSFSQSGIDVSHRMFILRQAYCVLGLIIDDSNANFTGTHSATPYILKTHSSSTLSPSPEIFGLTSGYKNPNLNEKDIELLSLFLHIAKTNYSGLADKSLMWTKLLEDKNVDLKKPPSTAPATYDDLLDYLFDGKKLEFLKALALATPVHAFETVANTPLEVANFTDIDLFYKSVTGDVNNKLYLVTDFKELFFNAPITVGATSIPVTSTTLGKSGSTTSPTSARYPRLLTLNSFSSQAIICLGTNSVVIAMEPIGARRGNNVSYEFVQDTNGRFNLEFTTKDGKQSFDYLKKITDLTDGNNACSAFGSLDKTKHDACGKLINTCLGGISHDDAACKVSFMENISDPSEKLRGWRILNSDEKRYFAYRILISFGFWGKVDENGDYVYFDRYSDDEIKAQMGKTASGIECSTKQIAYIKLLMAEINKIKTPKRNNSSTRPLLSSCTDLSCKEPSTINPRIIGFPVHFPMRGGSNQESQLQHIQYAGGIGDVEKIISKIKAQIEHLKKVNPRALPKAKEDYISDKLEKFRTLGHELDQSEKLITNYIIVASQHQAKDIVFTERDIEAIMKEKQEKMKKMVDTINKFDGLSSVMLSLTQNRMAIR